MTSERLQQVEAHGGAVDLSARAKFLLTGEDRVRYLNGQVTNDVRAANPQAAIHACVTNAKGRIEGDVYIHVSQAGGNGLWLDAEAGLREPLGMRLERYIISEDAVLQDVTDDWHLWHFFGPAADLVAALELPPGAGAVESVRFGQVGRDLWWPGSSAPLVPPPSVTILSADEAEALRVLRGIPRWPEELNGDAFPQEAGLEKRSMSFTKGCYIGQEVLSRIKTSGKMPRRLVRFVTTEDASRELAAAVEAGTPLVLFPGDDEPGKVVGSMTSIVRQPGLDRYAGLGYVRFGFDARDSLLLGSEEPPRIFAKVDISPS